MPISFRAALYERSLSVVTALGGSWRFSACLMGPGRSLVP